MKIKQFFENKKEYETHLNKDVENSKYLYGDTIVSCFSRCQTPLEWLELVYYDSNSCIVRYNWGNLKSASQQSTMHLEKIVKYEDVLEFDVNSMFDKIVFFVKR